MLRVLLVVLALGVSSGCHLQQANLWGFPVSSRIVKSIDRAATQSDSPRQRTGTGARVGAFVGAAGAAGLDPVSGAVALVVGYVALAILGAAVILGLDLLSLLVTLPHDLYVLMNEGRYESLPEWKPNPYYR